MDFPSSHSDVCLFWVAEKNHKSSDWHLKPEPALAGLISAVAYDVLEYDDGGDNLQYELVSSYVYWLTAMQLKLKINDRELKENKNSNA